MHFSDFDIQSLVILTGKKSRGSVGSLDAGEVSSVWPVT